MDFAQFLNVYLENKKQISFILIFSGKERYQAVPSKISSKSLLEWIFTLLFDTKTTTELIENITSIWHYDSLLIEFVNGGPHYPHIKVQWGGAPKRTWRLGWIDFLDGSGLKWGQFQVGCGEGWG